jgi:hypothetical protein
LVPLFIFPFSGPSTDSSDALPVCIDSPQLLLQPQRVSLIISLKNENTDKDGKGPLIQ